MDTIQLVCDTISVSMNTVGQVASNAQGDLSCNKWYWLLFGLSVAALVLLWVWYFSRKRKYYHDMTRKKRETHIYLQLLMLLCVLVSFFAICAILYHSKTSEWLKWFAGAGVLLTWIFQDTVKNVVAYITLKFNGLIGIEDWVILDKYGIDGEVTDISLSSVVVKNWDGSLSSISTKSILDAQIQNQHNVVEKKTSGRRMQRNFLIDVHSVHNLTIEQLLQLKKNIAELDGDDSVMDYAIAKGKKQNLQIFRLYLRHWMLSQETVTRSPKFAIRLLDQTSEGLPMQVYAFLLPTKWEEFEQEQARIVEHILETIGLFGLNLYQSQAGTDTNNVYLMKGE